MSTVFNQTVQVGIPAGHIATQLTAYFNGEPRPADKTIAIMELLITAAVANGTAGQLYCLLNGIEVPAATPRYKQGDAVWITLPGTRSRAATVNGYDGELYKITLDDGTKTWSADGLMSPRALGEPIAGNSTAYMATCVDVEGKPGDPGYEVGEELWCSSPCYTGWCRYRDYSMKLILVEFIDQDTGAVQGTWVSPGELSRYRPAAAKRSWQAGDEAYCKRARREQDDLSPRIGLCRIIRAYSGGMTAVQTPDNVNYSVDVKDLLIPNSEEARQLIAEDELPREPGRAHPTATSDWFKADAPVWYYRTRDEKLPATIYHVYSDGSASIKIINTDACIDTWRDYLSPREEPAIDLTHVDDNPRPAK